MTYKSNAQPFCRYCARPLRKHVVDVHLMTRPLNEADKAWATEGWSRMVYVEKLPQTVEECRRLSNQQIVSVKRSKQLDANLDKVVDRGIDRFGEWDGESYQGAFFCSSTCAQKLGRMWAEKGYGSKRWLDTISTTGDRKGKKA